MQIDLCVGSLGLFMEICLHYIYEMYGCVFV